MTTITRDDLVELRGSDIHNQQNLLFDTQLLPRHTSATSHFVLTLTPSVFGEQLLHKRKHRGTLWTSS